MVSTFLSKIRNRLITRSLHIDSTRSGVGVPTLAAHQADHQAAAASKGFGDNRIHGSKKGHGQEGQGHSASIRQWLAPQRDPEPSRRDPEPSRRDIEPSRRDIEPSRRDLKPSRQHPRPSRRDIEPSRRDPKPSRQHPRPSRRDIDPSRRDPKPSRQHPRPSRQQSEQEGEFQPRQRQEKGEACVGRCLRPHHEKVYARTSTRDESIAHPQRVKPLWNPKLFDKAVPVAHAALVTGSRDYSSPSSQRAHQGSCRRHSQCRSGPRWHR